MFQFNTQTSMLNDKLRVAIALALISSKPPEETIPSYILRLRSVYPLRVQGNGGASASVYQTEVSEDLASWTSRTRNLEQQLENSEAELARLKLDHHARMIRYPSPPGSPTKSSSLNTTGSSRPNSDPTPKKKGGPVKRKSDGDEPDVQPAKKKKKPLKGKPKDDAPPPLSIITEADRDSSPDVITLDRVLKCIKTERRIPPLSSSLDVLASYALLQRIPLTNPRDSPSTSRSLSDRLRVSRSLVPEDVNMEIHISRAIASIASLIRFSLGLEPPALDVKASLDARMTLKASSVLLGHVLGIIHTLSTALNSELGVKRLVAQLGSDIINPLVRSFYTLSFRTADLLCELQTVDHSLMPKDVRTEVLNVLRYLAAFTHRRPTPTLPSMPDVGFDTWLPEMISHLAALELLRITNLPSSLTTTTTQSSRLSSSTIKRLSKADQVKQTTMITKLARKDALWYLACIMHAAGSSQNPSSSSSQATKSLFGQDIRQSGDVASETCKVLAQVLGSDGRALDVVERDMLLGVVEMTWLLEISGLGDEVQDDDRLAEEDI